MIARRLIAVLAGAALLALGVSTALAAAPSAHDSATVKVAQLLKPHIAAVKRKDGGVAVLLPTTMPLDTPDFTEGSAQRGSYTLEIDGAPNCHEANVCLFAVFLAQRGGKLDGGRVTLSQGIRGGFTDIHCGGSCAPAGIDWIENGVLYTIQANVTVSGGKPNALRTAFIAAANQAIAAGPR